MLIKAKKKQQNTNKTFKSRCKSPTSKKESPRVSLAASVESTHRELVPDRERKPQIFRVQNIDSSLEDENSIYEK